MENSLVLVTLGKETIWRQIHRSEDDVARDISEMQWVGVAASSDK